VRRLLGALALTFLLASCGDDTGVDEGEPSDDTQFPESGHRGDVYTTIVQGELDEYECIVLDGTGTGDSDMECPDGNGDDYP